MDDFLKYILEKVSTIEGKTFDFKWELFFNNLKKQESTETNDKINENKVEVSTENLSKPNEEAIVEKEAIAQKDKIFFLDNDLPTKNKVVDTLLNDYFKYKVDKDKDLPILSHLSSCASDINNKTFDEFLDCINNNASSGVMSDVENDLIVDYNCFFRAKRYADKMCFKYKDCLNWNFYLVKRFNKCKQQMNQIINENKNLKSDRVEEFEMYFDLRQQMHFLKGDRRLLVTDSDIFAPANVGIKFLSTSRDVIHSFGVPSFGLKEDAVPGRLNQGMIIIRRPGVFHGQCSELCGTGHGYMPAIIVVMDLDTFNYYVRKYYLNNLEYMEKNNKTDID